MIQAVTAEFSRLISRHLGQRLTMVLFFVLLLPITVTPPSSVIVDDHAYASEAGYDYWAAHRFQWGVEVVQNIGPLGFLHFPLTYTGILDYENMVGNLIFSSFLDIAVIALFFKFPSIAKRFLFICGFILLQVMRNSANFVYTPEVNHYLVLFFAVYLLYLFDNFLVIFLVSILMAAMALGKGVFLTLTVLISFFYCSSLIFGRKYLKSFIFCLSLTAALCLFWKLSGQNFSNFFAFLKGSFEFSSGYNEALNGKPKEFWTRPNENVYAFVVLSFCIFAALLVLRKVALSAKMNGSSVLFRLAPLAFTELLFIFVLWKYGVVAFDKYHLMIPLLFLLVCLAPFSFFLPYQPVPLPVIGQIETSNGAKLNVYILSILILIGISSSAYYAGIRFIFRPKTVLSEADVKHRMAIANFQMAQMQRIVGTSSIGYFGERIAPMIYNNFNYVPSPSTISFVGWNDFFIDADSNFIRNGATAPKYMVYEAYNVPTSIAQQFWPLDSVKMQMEILKNYDPVLDGLHQPVQEIGRLLLRRREISATLSFDKIETRRAKILTEIKVPRDISDPLQLVVNLDHKPLAIMFGIFYKLPIYKIVLKLNTGEVIERMFSPAKARNGFVLNPLILSNDDYIKVISNAQLPTNVSNSDSTPRKVVSFAIRCSYLSVICTEDFDLQFNKISGLELGRSPIASQTDIRAKVDAYKR